MMLLEMCSGGDRLNSAAEQPAGLDRPVILLGRGGSGTRMLSELALGLGVFLGGALNETGDSLEWVESLRELGIATCAGELPAGSTVEFVWRERLRELAVTILARAGRDADALWGWKAPVTMVGLDVVLRAFPGARVIHLVRHPLSSALRRTHMFSRLDNPVGRAVLEAAYRTGGRDIGRLNDDESFVHNAMSWNYQIRRALAALAGAGHEPLQLRYEDVCAAPQQAQMLMADFIAAQVPHGASLCSTDWTRTNAIEPEDGRVPIVWSICGETAQSLGYGRWP